MENIGCFPHIFEKILSYLDIQSQFNCIKSFTYFPLSFSHLLLSTLFDHQVKSILSLQQNRHHVALYDTGCGKSFMACVAIKLLCSNKDVIFVAPKSIHSFITTNIHDMKIREKVSIITHYTFNKEINTTNKFLIIDEAHNFRNYKKRGKNVVKACRQAWKILLMTATPIVNTSRDLDVLFDMCRLTDDHMLTLEDLNIVYKNKNPEESFPKVIVKDIHISLTGDEASNYQKFQMQVLDEMDTNLTDRIGKMTNHFMLYASAMLRVGDSGLSYLAPKIRYIKDTIYDYKKQIIFSSWIKAGIDQVAFILKNDVLLGVISGKTSQKERERIIRDYNNGKIQVLLFSKAGSEGVNLKETNRVIIMEPGWNCVLEKQAMDRAIRIDSHISLPEDERKVIVEKLYIDHPLSIDRLIKEKYCNKKEAMLSDFLNNL